MRSNEHFAKTSISEQKSKFVKHLVINDDTVQNYSTNLTVLRKCKMEQF